MLPATWDVPQNFRDRLGSSVGRQRAMLSDGHLLLVLHAPPDPDQDQRKGRFFWRKPDGVWASDQMGSGPGAVDLARPVPHFEPCDTPSSSQTPVLQALVPYDRLSKVVPGPPLPARNGPRPSDNSITVGRAEGHW